MLWEMPHISIAPEEIFKAWGIPVTNTMFMGWITLAIILVIGFFATRKRDLIPSGFQNFFEWVIELIIGMIEGFVGKKKAMMFFPIVGSFLLFIVVANLLDVIPGVDTIGAIHDVHHHAVDPKTTVAGPVTFLFGKDTSNLVPWIRPATTDLNLTVALAISAVVICQIFGFATLGWKEHLTKYFNFPALKKGPMGLIDLMVGIIEIASELGRVISFAFRLFGNIFAGSVLLMVFGYLLPVITTAVFVPFEIFVGVLQGYVFALLTTIFLDMATTSHHGDDHGHGEHHAEHGEETVRTASSH